MEEATRRITRRRHRCWIRFTIRLHSVMGRRAVIKEIHGKDNASNKETLASVLLMICQGITFCDRVSSCHDVVDQSEG